MFIEGVSAPAVDSTNDMASTVRCEDGDRITFEACQCIDQRSSHHRALLTHAATMEYHVQPAGLALGARRRHIREPNGRQGRPHGGEVQALVEGQHVGGVVEARVSRRGDEGALKSPLQRSPGACK